MNKLLDFAFKYSKLMPTERDIIEFLYNRKKHLFEGGYSDLVRAMGLSTYQNVSNYRKTVLELAKKKIIMIVHKPESTRMVFSINLSEDWQETILNHK